VPENLELPDTASSVRAFRLCREEAQKKSRRLMSQAFDILRDAEVQGAHEVGDARALLEESGTTETSAWESFDVLEGEVVSYGLDVLALEDAVLDYASYKGNR